TGRGPGEADVRRFSTSAATPSAACYGLALAALRRDLRTPPPACQYLCCHSVGCVLRPRPRCAPARPPHAASCVSVPLLPLRRLRATASPSLRSGETSARRLLRVRPAGLRWQVAGIRTRISAHHKLHRAEGNTGRHGALDCAVTGVWVLLATIVFATAIGLTLRRRD